MGLILLEALLALIVLVAIVWWTMFSGRKGGEPPPAPLPPASEPEDADTKNSIRPSQCAAGTQNKNIQKGVRK